MKQNTKIVISIVTAIVIVLIISSFDVGKRNEEDYYGMILGSIIFFFVIYWLLGFISDSEIVKEVQEKRELNEKINNDIKNYQEAKNSFKYFSEDKLMIMYLQFQQENIENFERLALEEELVERGLIKSSSMHEKLYEIKKNLMS